MVHGKFDITIIGGGIIGLSVGMAFLARYPGRRVALIEKEMDLALHQSGHNSGVIHSGLYYRPGSQKAEFCLTGGKLLREFCDEEGVTYRTPGKLVVATSQSQVPGLLALHKRGLANGLTGLELLNTVQLQTLEPEVTGFLALHCPSAGIVDYTEVARVMAERNERNGLELFLSAEVIKISSQRTSIQVETVRGDIETKYLVNCAGLHADRVMSMMGFKSDVKIIPFRGEYYKVVPNRENVVGRLIYPVPDPRFPFLGVHFTPRINGSLEAGPNAVLSMAKEGYTRGTVNVSDIAAMLRFPGFWLMAGKYWKTGFGEVYRSLDKRAFTRTLQELVPVITGDDLEVGGSGVRAQAVTKSGTLLDDFSVVVGQRAIHVQNAPSPAATSSIPIGMHVVKLAETWFNL